MGNITHASLTDSVLTETIWDAAHKDSRGNSVVPSRSATLVVAASDSSDASKAGADYEDSEINVAITACNVAGFGSVRIMAGTHTSTSQIVMKSNVEVICDIGVSINVTPTDTSAAFLFDDLSNAIWRGGTLTREGTTGGDCVAFSGTTDSTCQMPDTIIENNCVHALNDSFGTYVSETAAPKLWNVKSTGSTSSGQNMDGFRIEDTSAPQLYNCKGYGGAGTGTRSHGIYVTETANPVLWNCEGVGGANVSSHSQGIVLNGTANTVVCFNCIGRGGGGTQANGFESGQTVYLKLYNCEGYAGDGNNSRGFSTDKTPSNGNQAISDNGEIHGGYYVGGAGTSSQGFYVNGPIKIRTYGVHAKGGSGATNCHGGYVLDGALIYDYGSTFEGGATDGYGFLDSSAGGEMISSKFIHCLSGTTGANNALHVDKSNTRYIGCLATPPRREGMFRYIGSTYSITPIASQAYMLIGVALNVTTEVGAATLEIGTSDGGGEIATGVSLASSGWVYFEITKPEIAADTAFYAKPSDTDARFDLYYIVIPNDANQYALWHKGVGASYDGCTFISNGASDAVYLNNKYLTMNNCTLETLDPTGQKSLNAASSLTDVKLNNCTLIGGTNNVTFEDINFQDRVIENINRITTGQTAVGYMRHYWLGDFTSDGTAAYAALDAYGGTLTGYDGDTDFLAGLDFSGQIVTQDNSETVDVVAQLRLREPRITKGTDTITKAATLYIIDAPTEGANNAAIWVNAGNQKFAGSVDSAAVADQVAIGGYEIGAGNRVLSLSQETAVAAEVDETKFSHKLQVRINGATYYIMLTQT